MPTRTFALLFLLLLPLVWGIAEEEVLAEDYFVLGTAFSAPPSDPLIDAVYDAIAEWEDANYDVIDPWYMEIPSMDQVDQALAEMRAEDPHGRYALEGSLYLHPLLASEAPNVTAARLAFERGVARGEAESQYFLGLLYELGLGVDQSTQKALVLYQFAAAQEHPWALATLSFKSRHGHGVPRDCVVALRYLQRALRHFVVRVMDTGLPVYAFPQIALKDPLGFDDSVLQFRAYGARSGDPASQVVMAVLHLQGYPGVAYDPVQAHEYLEQAIAVDHPAAFGYMGLVYEKGYGVDADLTVAQSYYRKGIVRGDGLSEARMALFHLFGWDMPTNEAEAVRLFTAAADRGNALGSMCLGVLEHRGHGVPSKPSSALRHMAQAARDGDVTAVLNLSHMRPVAQCSASVQELVDLLEKKHSGDLFAALDMMDTGRTSATLYHLLRLSAMGLGDAGEEALYVLDLLRSSHPAAPPSAWLDRTETALLSQGAVLGNPSAMLRLGDRHYYGAGGPAKAAALYAVASQGGSAQAACNTGWMYGTGDGLPRDPYLAERAFDRCVELRPTGWVVVRMMQWVMWGRAVWAAGVVGGEGLMRWDTLVMVVSLLSLVGLVGLRISLSYRPNA